MKIITAALVSLLLAGAWLQAVGAKSSEFGWSRFAPPWGGRRRRQVLWGWGRAHPELTAFISTPPERILPEEEEGRTCSEAGGQQENHKSGANTDR